jgi:hypothetical protein
MTEDEFVLTQERINNIEAHCRSIERDMAEYMSDNPKGNDQWIEKRVRVLEDKVNLLMDQYIKAKDLRNGKGTKADSRSGSSDKL